MYTVDKSRIVRTVLDWNLTQIRTGIGAGTTVQRGQNTANLSIRDWRTRSRVDPERKIIHGHYEREYTDFKSYPTVVALLRRVTKGASQSPLDVTINVSGAGFGYAPFRCRYLFDDEKAKATLINNCIKGAMEQSVDLATAIAEMDKTGKLLADKAGTISKAVGEIRKGQFTRAARTLKIKKPRGASRSKAFSNNLLEYQYGWMPIVQDMSGSLIHMAKGLRDLIVTARDRTSSSVETSQGPAQIEQYRYATAQDRLIVRWMSSSTWQRMEQVELLFRLSSGFWDQVSRLGFLNPGQVAYQTIPGSFLLDWFSNTGDVIAAMNRELTLEYVTGSYTQFHRNDGQVWAAASWWTDQNTSVYRYVSLNSRVYPGSFTDFKVKREVIEEPEVAVTWQLSAPLSWNKALTALALVRQQL